ncbi:BZ3500_MvSof-1268-A1-R1_Chr5-3g08213 [Microbotryum saponariae]|uniref:BZ3500_MvSof-1268-A1-R1_Chr5-3g08213 protein n=1 Tax=Microbotryum saponariae TaxID=289078 RepID=A0A2X0KFK0_9BASI|nr:BZ3500_MvSof-1268-A1-R1_Chr5-3g08213 [Microbotryum saponariae]SDA07972.1 BZ3501_MvSof-1269-A2-R1_Chr5-1g07357 [Microbotryum saponariae]
MTTSTPPNELLLLVFLHGFKGGADTFAAFPDRLRHNLEQTEPRCEIQSHVYPPYDTRGELTVAVDKHVSWLTDLVATKKCEFSEKGGTGPLRVILLGHSMGGLVIADSTLSALGTLPILGLICYDSPLLGLHPAVFRNTFDKALGYASQGQAALSALTAGYGFIRSTTGNASALSSGSGKTTPPKGGKKPKEVAATNSASSNASSSKGWFSLATMAGVGAAVGAIGAAGAAYYNREAIGNHWSWATSHLSFVGELWKTTEMEQRIQHIVEAQEKGVGFHCFYTHLPPKKDLPERTFCVLPNTPVVRERFTPNSNHQADDEITAHIEMFTEKSDGLYDLAQKSCALISDWVDAARKGKMGAGVGEKVDGSAGKEKVEEPENERMG